MCNLFHEFASSLKSWMSYSTDSRRFMAVKSHTISTSHTTTKSRVINILKLIYFSFSKQSHSRIHPDKFQLNVHNLWWVTVMSWMCNGMIKYALWFYSYMPSASSQPREFFLGWELRQCFKLTLAITRSLRTFWFSKGLLFRSTWFQNRKIATNESHSKCNG